MPITALYAGLLVAIYLYLTFRVIGQRRAKGIDLGDGGDRLAARYIRAHANFAEYVPLGLVLLLILEIDHWADWILHVLGIALVAGRVLHAQAFSVPEYRAAPRAAGMVLTTGMLAVAALLCLVDGTGLR
ncbi:MAG: MAPEG family protein [Geminicoccaceae bacterium]